MNDEIEIEIHGSKEHPRIVEVDANEMGAIIAKVTHAPLRLCARAANEICDYLARVHRASMGLM